MFEYVGNFLFDETLYIAAKVLPAFVCPWFLARFFTVLILHYTTLLRAPLPFPTLKLAAGV